MLQVEIVLIEHLYYLCSTRINIFIVFIYDYASSLFFLALMMMKTSERTKRTTAKTIITIERLETTLAFVCWAIYSGVPSSKFMDPKARATPAKKTGKEKTPIAIEKIIKRTNRTIRTV